MYTLDHFNLSSDRMQLALINKLADAIKAAGGWDARLQRLLDEDRELGRKAIHAPCRTFDGSQTDWELAGDDWQRKAERFGILVIDDAEKGTTWIGTELELEAAGVLGKHDDLDVETVDKLPLKVSRPKSPCYCDSAYHPQGH